MDKNEFHVVIKYCFLKGKNTVETKTWLEAEFPDTAPGKSTIKDCLTYFLQGNALGKLVFYDGYSFGWPQKDDYLVLSLNEVKFSGYCDLQDDEGSKDGVSDSYVLFVIIYFSTTSITDGLAINIAIYMGILTKICLSRKGDQRKNLSIFFLSFIFHF
ncbi:hypothetical protein GWI33_023105 [Rhynchophorus ferrugineus]|uniref:Uncharacterized protein n=1 Tax=Rhynchophorus ferrugineus TaxID=354439 RepID=A0A834MH34_RHYFE|nr:hypothetical protein GWI33_023105 [Rhynchophorus ferrugineus]